MVVVLLDCKIESTSGEPFNDFLKEELRKELKIIAKNLSEKVNNSLNKKIKIYNQGA